MSAFFENFLFENIDNGEISDFLGGNLKKNDDLNFQSSNSSPPLFNKTENFNFPKFLSSRKNSFFLDDFDQEKKNSNQNYQSDLGNFQEIGKEENEMDNEDKVCKDLISLEEKDDFMEIKFNEEKDSLNNSDKWIEDGKISLKKNIAKDRKFTNLAIRNIKGNFGTAIIHFVEFLKEISLQKNNKKKIREFSELHHWILPQQKNLRTFLGWRNLLTHSSLGKKMQRICNNFFGNSFAESYVLNSKIKKEYKVLYFDKISKFLEGSKHPKNFFSFENIKMN